MSDSGWVSVRCLFRTTWEGGNGCYEERITLWHVDDLQRGIELAEAEAQQYADGLSSPQARTSYLGLAQAFLLFDEPGQSREVFSLIRDSDLPPEEYLRAHFDTGHERVNAVPAPSVEGAAAVPAGTEPSASSWWSLDRTSSQEKIHQLVSSLRPPARAYQFRRRPVSLQLPLTSQYRFVSEQVIGELLGARLAPVDVLPVGSRWHYALDADDADTAPSAGGISGPSRVYLYGTPPGVEVEELTLGDEVIARGGAQMTVDFAAEPQSVRLGPRYDAARGDALGLLVKGRPAHVAVTGTRLTMLGCEVVVGGRPARLSLACAASPAAVLTSVLWTDGLT